MATTSESEFCPRCGLTFGELPDYVPEAGTIAAPAAVPAGERQHLLELMAELTKVSFGKGSPAMLMRKLRRAWERERELAEEAASV